MDALVLLNPDASRARRDLTRIRGVLADSSLFSAADVKTCLGWEETRDRAARAASRGYELVVAGGGDGTVNAVANGLMAVEDGRPVLGVLPLGTGNDLARSLGLPTDWQRAVGSLEQEVVRPMDLFRLEMGNASRFAANASAGGFSGQVGEDLTEGDKERWGPLAYLKTALEQVARVPSYDAILIGDDGVERELSLCNVVVANGRWAAGGLPVAPRAEIDDGRLDVIVLRSAPVARLGAAVATMAAGRHMDHELVTAFRCETLEIRASPPLGFNVDGELLGTGDARFEVVPRALRVLVGDVDRGAWSG